MPDRAGLPSDTAGSGEVPSQSCHPESPCTTNAQAAGARESSRLYSVAGTRRVRARFEVRHRIVVENDAVARAEHDLRRCSAARRAASAARSTARRLVCDLDVDGVGLHQCPEHCILLSSLAAACADSIVARGKRSVNAVPRPTSLSTAIVPSSCSTMRLVIARPRPEAAALGRDEVVEDRRQPIGRNARCRCRRRDLDVGRRARGRDRHAAARLGRLNRVGDEVAVDAAQREAVAVDDQRARARSCASTATPLRSPSGAHRLDDFRSPTTLTSIAKRSIGFGLTMLRRSSRKRLIVVSSRSIGAAGTCSPRFRVDIVAQRAGGCCCRCSESDASRSCTRPAATRPNIAWRSWRLDVFLQLDRGWSRHRVERRRRGRRTRRPS